MVRPVSVAHSVVAFSFLGASSLVLWALEGAGVGGQLSLFLSL